LQAIAVQSPLLKLAFSIRAPQPLAAAPFGLVLLRGLNGFESDAKVVRRTA
jgi:hypothetical protein